MLAAPIASADETPSPSPTGTGYGAPPVLPSVGLSVKSPECDGDVPYLRYAVDVSKDPGATAVDLTWTSLDGTHSFTQKNLPIAGKVLWLGAAEAGGQPTAWPGWVFKNGTWEEGGPYTWVRPDVNVTFTVHDSQYGNVAATGASAHATISDGVYHPGVAASKVSTGALVLPAANTVTSEVGYPPATTACANPVTAVTTVSPTSGTSTAPVAGSSTAAVPGAVVPGSSDHGSRSEARSGLAETGMNVLPFAAAAVLLLVIGGVLLLVSRRHRKLPY
jgi:hypothetical protein